MFSHLSLICRFKFLLPLEKLTTIHCALIQHGCVVQPNAKFDNCQHLYFRASVSYYRFRCCGPVSMETSSSLPADLSSTNPGADITGEMETDALVRVSTFPLPDTASNKKRRRRLGKRAATLAGPPSRQQSFSRDIGHAAAETYLVTRLTFKLLSYLGYYL